VVVELAETHAGEPYRLPLDVGVVTADGGARRTERVELVSARQRFEIAADEEPAAVELDPDVWILMDASFVRRSGPNPR
jgi:hypothetical protein